MADRGRSFVVRPLQQVPSRVQGPSGQPPQEAGNLHLLADVAGCYGATGATFTPVAPKWGANGKVTTGKVDVLADVAGSFTG